MHPALIRPPINRGMFVQSVLDIDKSKNAGWVFNVSSWRNLVEKVTSRKSS